MPIQLNEETGKLAAADYEHLVPEFERLHGWTAGALWADTKFAIHHFSDIARLAVIGENKWQEGMATFCQPFTKATIRYFEHGDAAGARAWLGEA